MADLLWPLHIVPNTMPWQIIDSTAAFSSPTSGYTRTASAYGVRRWGASINIDNLRTADRAYVQGNVVARLQGRAGRVYLPCFDYVRRGVFPTGELLSNNTFDGSTGYSCGSTTNIAVSNRVFRSTWNTASGTFHPLYSPQATVVSGANYVVRIMLRQGKGLPSPLLDLCAGTTNSNVSLLFGAGSASYGLRTGAFVASGTAAFLTLRLNSAAAIGDYIDVLYVSMSRCLLVNGASQSGSALNVDGYSGTLAGALVSGDMAEIILPNFSQLVRLTADLDLNSSGAGYLQFEPALRQVPADNASIIINQPLGRFMSADGTIEWDNKPGPGGNPLTDTSINFVESVQ